MEQYYHTTDPVFKGFVHACWIHVPLIIASNVLVIAATYFIKQLHTPDNLIIGGVAVMDLLTGLFSIPLTWSLLNKNIIAFTSNSKPACYLSILGCYFPKVSLAYLFLMAIERFMAIKYPYTYHKYTSERLVIIAMILIFFIILLEGLIALFNPDREDIWKYGMSRKNNSNQCEYTKRLPKLYWFKISPILILFQIIISLVLTFQVAYIAWRQIHRDTGDRRTSHFYDTSEMKNQLVQIKITIVLMFIYAVLWMPWALKAVVAASGVSTETLYRYKVISIFITYMNAWVNAIVYAVSKPTYREAYLFLLTHWPWDWPKVNRLFKKATYAFTSSELRRTCDFDTVSNLCTTKSAVTAKPRQTSSYHNRHLSVRFSPDSTKPDSSA